MRSVSGVGRVAALAAVIAAAVLVAVLLFGGGGSGYTVRADFLNAGQLVHGNPVQTGGVPIGSVKDIAITDDGHAQIKFSVDDDHSPLPVGTHATIRQFSQSGIANRYIDLTFPPQSKTGQEEMIDDGGHISADDTTTAVDLDELFNTLDPPTRKALQGFFKGQARQFAGMGKQANVGFHYLNPSLSTSSRFFNELSRDTPTLERFLVDSSSLVTALAEKRDQLSSLISNLSTTTTALASQKTALADAIQELPPFMRRANTTFVNLRSTLDDVDPLVQASKPVAKQLGPFLHDARALVANAKPTVRDLRITIQRAGRSNDLIDLINSFPKLADFAVLTKRRTAAPGGRKVDVGVTRGSLPESTAAFKAGAPEIAMGRAYTTDFFGWFDDFSTTGAGFDALGATARGHLVFTESLGATSNGHFQRCPGSAEPPAPDGSNVLSQDEQDALSCKESDRASD